MEFIKNLFMPLTPKRVVESQLAESRLQLLIAESTREWAESQVTLHKKRIERLEQRSGEAS